MSLTAWIIIGIIACLVGFIVLQRRRPDVADKISGALDSAAKKTEAEASAAAQALRDKFGKK
jgi:hypothetical protein